MLVFIKLVETNIFTSRFLCYKEKDLNKFKMGLAKLTNIMARKYKVYKEVRIQMLLVKQTYSLVPRGQQNTIIFF